MDDFIARMQQKHSLELLQVTGRIGGTGPRASDTAAVGGPGVARAQPSEDGPLASGGLVASSLLEAAQRLAADSEKVGEHMVEALSSHVSVLACIPVHAPSPWASVGLSELKVAANSDFAAGVPSPRGLGGSTLSMTWESLGLGLGVRLLLLWSGGGTSGAELHMCRVGLTPAPPGTTPPLKLERARIHACGGSSMAHFVLCQMYDPSHAAALVLQEQPSAAGGAMATVCLIDMSLLAFSDVPRLGGASADISTDDLTPAIPLPAAVALEGLTEAVLRRSVVLPESYIWSSAMRCMATRGVCSVYARRARRLLTLDMDAEADGDEDIDDDIGG